MNGYVGSVVLGGTIKGVIITTDASNTPTNASALPIFRVYGPTALMTNGTGTCSFLDSGSITGVANNGSGACRITCASHGLTTGTRVTITGVAGATGANITAVVTVISSSTFDLDGSTFGGTYTSGGTWNVTGAYRWSVNALGADGYEAGRKYEPLFTFTVSVAKGLVQTFMVT